MQVPSAVNKALNFVGVLLVASLVICISLQVFMRYFIRAALSWADEIACYNLVWLTFYGAMLCSRDREHLEVTVLTDVLPKILKDVCVIIGDIIVVVFLVVFFFAAIKLIQINGTQLSPALEIPMKFLYSMPVFASALMFIFTVGHFIKDVVKIVKGGQ